VLSANCLGYPSARPCQRRTSGIPSGPTRLTQRAARAQTREALAWRFTVEQTQFRAQRSWWRQTLKGRHRQERDALSLEHREERRKLSAAARADGHNSRIVLSLWAYAAARERETLQRRHASERRALTREIPRSEVWRVWLERQAAGGDEAAKAALRGIRYREQRRRRVGDGIAGEEIMPLRPLTVVAPRAEADATGLTVV